MARTPARADPRAAADAFAAALARHRSGDLAAAIAGYDRAVALDPRHAGAHGNAGIALAQSGQPAAALARFAAALAIDPRHADALANRGLVLSGMGDKAAALASCEAALAATPGHLTAAMLAGRLAAELGRPEAALATFDRVVAANPGIADAHYGRGLALLALFRLEEAVAAFDAVLQLAPQHLDALCNKGYAEGELKRFADAVASYDRVLALDPGRAFVREQRHFLARQLCQWQGFDADIAAVTDAVRRGTTGVSPQILLAMVDDPALQRQAAARFLAGHAPAPAPAARDFGGRRLRIGYVSADFHAHATLYLLADMLAAHDRSRFEVTLFSHGPDRDDAWRRRAVAAADAFVPIGAMSDSEAAAELRRREIDIAVDLKGVTAYARFGIFAARAAPLQVSFLGYPGTLGHPALDYLVADHLVIPPAEREHYSEQILWLRGSYQPNSRRGEAAVPSRAAAGLPDGAMVYVCCNQPYKITPALFAAWMAILAAVPDSVLWLWSDDDVTRANLRAAAAGRGIDPGRLVFAASTGIEDHVARLALADLFLDTLPYNAHTSGSDALAAGVPLLTLPGRSFAARVAASLLHACLLPELVVGSLDEYRALAIALGQDAPRRAALRARLAAALPAAPLFDATAFARHLEAGFVEMQRRALAGLPPADIEIAA